MKKSFFTLVFLVACQYCMAQKYLVLYKSGTDKAVYYAEGSTVRIKEKGDDESLRRLDLVEMTYFLSGRDTIYYNDIAYIYLPEKESLSKGTNVLSDAMIKGGFGLALFTLANTAIVNDFDKDAARTLIITGATIGVSGVVLRILKRKKRRIKGYWKLQVRYSKV